MTIHEELKILDDAVQAVRKLYENGEKLNQRELAMIGSCTGSLRSYLNLWREKN